MPTCCSVSLDVGADPSGETSAWPMSMGNRDGNPRKAIKCISFWPKKVGGNSGGGSGGGAALGSGKRASIRR